MPHLARCALAGPTQDVGPNIHVCPHWIHSSRVNRTSGGFILGPSTCYGLDLGLLNNLVRFFGDATVIDVGAGVGCYLYALRHAGVSVIAAYDAAPGIERITRGAIIGWDATQPLPLPHQPDWIYSLETAEHVPRNGTLNFVRNLAAARCGAIVSWAAPGQGGLGHINNRAPHQVVGMFKTFDMHLDHNDTTALRRGVQFAWFKKNTLVFRHGAHYDHQRQCATLPPDRSN